MNHLSKKKRSSLQQGRSGAALVISIIVLILTSAISLSLLKTTTLRQYRFQNRLQKIQANSLAESAISYATVKLQADVNYQGEEWQVDIAGEKGVATITIEKLDGELIQIDVVARYPTSLPTAAKTSRQKIIESSSAGSE